MPSSFLCPCGHRIPSPTGNAPRRKSCPKCGRPLSDPGVAPDTLSEGAWDLQVQDASPRAEQAGVLRSGLGSVVLSSSRSLIDTDLSVTGEVGCWHCRGTVPFSGTAFGRSGIGGRLAAASCPRCRALIEVEYALFVRGDETDLFVVVPSAVRGGSASGTENAPCLPLRVFSVSTATPVELPATRGQVQELLTRATGILRSEDERDELHGCMAELVQSRIPERMNERLWDALRELLDRETDPSAVAALAEALLCLRDPEAGKTVSRAVTRALTIGVASSTEPLFLENLSLLPLTFGYQTGFLETQPQFRSRSKEATRARHLHRRLSLTDVRELIEQGENLTSYDTTLGGTRWRKAYVLSKDFLDTAKQGGSGIWGRLRQMFGQVEQRQTEPSSTPEGGGGPMTGEDFLLALGRHYGDETIDLAWVKMNDEKGAEDDFRRIRRAVSRHAGADRDLVLFRGVLADTMETGWIIGLACLHSHGDRLGRWFERCVASFRHATPKVVEALRDQPADNPGWTGTLCSVADFHGPGLDSD